MLRVKYFLFTLFVGLNVTQHYFETRFVRFFLMSRYKKTQEILRKNRENGPRTTKNKPKETVTIITKDLIRTIPVPREDPSGKSMVIPRGHFQRIKNSSRVCSQSEIEREAALRQRERGNRDYSRFMIVTYCSRGSF